MFFFWRGFPSHLNSFRQFSSVTQLCLTLCDPMDCSTLGFPVHHQPQSLLKLMSIESVMPSNHLILLSSPSPPTFNLSQHQGLFWWVGLSHQVAKVLEIQHQHQSLQWIFRIDFLNTGKTIVLTIQTFVRKLMFLLLNMLSRFVIAFLLRSKRLFISWLLSPSIMILELRKIVSVTSPTFFPFYLPWSDGTRCHDLSFFNVF